MSKCCIEMKLLSLIYYIISMIFTFFTKHSEILFLGENQYCYNYGFPFRVFIIDSNNDILHIDTINIIFNFVALLPLILPMSLCKLNQKLQRTNNALIFIFCLYVIIALCLPWNYKKYIYSLALLLYGLWSAWFIFLSFYFIVKHKK